VLLIIIPAGATVTSRQAHRLETTGPVTGSPVLALIDITLHQKDGVAPLLLPVGVEPLKT
jgi:hypothetical protein